MFALVLTLLVKAGGQLLSLLKVRAREQLQHLLDAPPAGARQDLGQSNAQRGVATVHVGDVVGILRKLKTKKGPH